MAILQAKQQLFEHLYDARESPIDEKATAWDRFYELVDQVRIGTPYSRAQVKEFLYKDGYLAYALLFGARRKNASD